MASVILAVKAEPEKSGVILTAFVTGEQPAHLRGAVTAVTA